MTPRPNSVFVHQHVNGAGKFVYQHRMRCFDADDIASPLQQHDCEAAEADSLTVSCGGAGERALLAGGGRGGRGNASFKTSRNNAPAMAEHGAAGTELWLDLELKLVADVGIIGVPNAGKSTLLSVVGACCLLLHSY